MLQARDIGKAEVQLLGAVILCVFQYFLRIHSSSMGKWVRGDVLSRADGA